MTAFTYISLALALVASRSLAATTPELLDKRVTHTGWVHFQPIAQRATSLLMLTVGSVLRPWSRCMWAHRHREQSRGRHLILEIWYRRKL